MNVLGYDLASAPVSPIPLPSTDLTLSAGQLLEDLTLNQINPGSVNPPAGDSYVVVDTAFDLESLTAAEITQALAIGVSEFIADGAIAFLQGSDPADDQIDALAGTPFIAALTVAEAQADAANPPLLSAGETVIVADTAANIETLTASDVANLGTTLGATQFDVSDLSGTGPLIVQNGDTYAVHGAVTSDETITFTGAGGTLAFDDTPDMKGTISGFSASDQIVLSDIANDPNGSADLVANNVLDVTENGATYSLQLDQTQNFSGDILPSVGRPHRTGTDIVENTTPCYCRGTLIQTRARTEAGRKSQDRRQGHDQIRRGAADQVDRPAQLWRALHHGPQGYFADLHQGRRARRERAAARSLDFAASRHVSSNGVLIEAKDLVNGFSIVQAERVERVEYFHVELETHDVIVAEGALSETFLDDDSRCHVPQCARIPDALSGCGTAGVAQYCAPRLDDGYEVEAVRRRIALRAGLAAAADPHRARPLRGYIDAISPGCIEGWAQNADHPRRRSVSISMPAAG